MNELARVQRAFQARILAAEPGLERLLIGAPAALETRVAIYVDGYGARLVEALGTTYEALKTVLGDEQFEREMLAYVGAVPSRHYSVRYYGAGVAEHFAARSDEGRDQTLAELARFEWLLAAAFDAPDDVPAAETALTSLRPETWASARFGFRQSLQRFRSSTNAVDWWRAAKAGAPEPKAPDVTTLQDWVLWRRGVTTLFRSLDAVEASALAVAAEGGTFASLCAVVAEAEEPSEAALRSAMIVRRWFADELLTGVAQG